MYDTIETRAKLEITKQLTDLNARARFVSEDREFFKHTNGTWRTDDYRQDFERFDSLLRSIYTDSAIAFLYTDVVKTITFANRGEVALKELIDKVTNYQKGTR